MEKETIALSQRELQRWQLIGLAEVGNITLKEAGEKTGVSYRQAKRIRLKVKIKRGQDNLDNVPCFVYVLANNSS